MADQNESFENEKMLSEKKFKDCLYSKCEENSPVKEYGTSGKVKHVKTVTNILAGCLMAVNILLMIGLLALVVKWREDRINSLAPREQKICVKCVEIGLDGKNLPDHIKGKISLQESDDPKKSTCCGNTSDVLDLMVPEAIKDRGTGFKSSLHLFETKECKKTRKEVPSAQMNGIIMSEIAKGKTDVIPWKTTGVSFSKEGITYSNGRLSTRQSGYFYVFSQIKFNKCYQPPEKIDTSHKTIFLNERVHRRLDHFIYRYSNKDGKTQKILEGSKSICEVPALNDGTTSSIGAVFYLAENDAVFVNTSHPECLTPSQEGNHFGVYLT